MLQRTLTALTSKAAIAVAVGTLAAGAAATAGPALVNDTRPDDSGRTSETELLHSSDDLTTEKATELARDGHADEAAKDDAAHDRGAASDSFGAVVSEDARDGGVDGQEISELARERNAERAADRSGPLDADADDNDDAHDADHAADDTDDGHEGRGRGRGDDRGDRRGDRDTVRGADGNED